MDNGNDHNGLINKYLAREMAPEEQADFETRMQSDPELRKEVNDLAGIRLGLKAHDVIESGHINVKLLVTYQENRSQLDKQTRLKIETHLKECPSCSEELELCRLQADSEFDEERDKTESFLGKIQDFFMRPVFNIRPVYGMAAAVIILAAIIGIQGISDRTPQIAHFEIVPGEKSIENKNNFVIDEATEIITLYFSPGVREDCVDCLYDFELYDPSGSLRLTSQPHKYQKDFAFELESSYFSTEGYYSIRVYEKEDDGIRDLIENYWLRVRLKN